MMKKLFPMLVCLGLGWACSSPQEKKETTPQAGVSSPSAVDSVVTAQRKREKQLKNAMSVQCKRMGTALQKGNYDLYASMLHPYDVKKSGGANLLARSLDTYMRSSGVKIRQVDFSEPDTIMVYNGIWQGILKQKLQFESQGQVVNGKEVRLIGFSKDQGESWYFGDITITDWESMRRSYPELSPDWQSRWDD